MPGVGGDGGPSIGPDGTVYVGSGERITAVAPDGTIRWTFVEPTNGQGVIAGPTVGPDGNIYVVARHRRHRRIRAVPSGKSSLE